MNPPPDTTEAHQRTHPMDTKKNRQPNTLSQLEADLGALFGGGRQRRVKGPTEAPRLRYVVQVGSNAHVANPIPELDHLRAPELGRYASLAEAKEAQQAYNREHKDAEIYAWTPTEI